MTTQSAQATKLLLATQIQKHWRQLGEWQLAYAQKTPPPFYCSVDLRDFGHKIVPVDSNLYPAGFNNICADDIRTAPQVVRAHIEEIAGFWKKPVPKKILVLPESHTSNTFYIENLYYLTQIFKESGFEVRVGWYGDMPRETLHGMRDGGMVLKSATDKEVVAYPIEIQDRVLSAGGFTPDLVILNNDFSSGYPKPLDGIAQPVIPSHRLGWHSRKKSDHFEHYNRLAGEFASIIGVDPWIISIDTEKVEPVNFGEDEGIEQVAQSVERVIARTKAAYDQRKIQQEPFVFVKNNSGTYGMGIMVVHSGEELRTMNRRTKNKMSVGKNKLAINSICVQEGIPTTTLIDRLAAEPVIYLVGSELIGGFLRTNSERGTEDNLNSQGMVFRKLCMSDLARPTLGGPQDHAFDDALEDASVSSLSETTDLTNANAPVLELVYGSIARISALATGIELAERIASGTA